MAKSKKTKQPGRKPAHPKAAEMRELLDKVRQPKGPEGKKPIEKDTKKTGSSQTGGGKHLERKGRTKK